MSTSTETGVAFSRITTDDLERWKTTRDAVAGAQAVRAGDYLPTLNAADRSPENAARNQGYRQRAVYYNVTGRTLEGLLGLAFKRDPITDLPPKLQYLLSSVDGGKVSLYQQAQGALSSVLTAGRHGLYVDYQDGRAVIKAYSAESIINWDNKAKPELIVLSEAVETRGEDGFSLETSYQLRELALENGVFVCRVWTESADGDWVPKTVTSEDLGAQQLNYIPFQFIGSKANDSAIDPSPMFGLAGLNIAHYRNSADYEDNVFSVGQVQPVIAGLTEQWAEMLQKNGQVYVGPSSALLLPVGGTYDLKQASPNTMVLVAMEHKEAQMAALGAQIIQRTQGNMTATQADNNKEAGTSVLSMCASNVSEAYQSAIGMCADRMGLGDFDASASFKITQDFGSGEFDPQTAMALATLWQQGVIGLSDARASLRKIGVIATERSDEDIQSEIDSQGPALGMAGLE